MPYLDRSIFGAGYNDWQFRVVAGKADIARVSFQRGNQGLGRIIPYFDGLIIRGTQEVGFVTVRIVVDVVDALLVGFDCLLRCWVVNAPNLDGSV